MKTKCEVCENPNLAKVLDLGDHPLCDDLVAIADPRICKEYPIKILLCDKCHTALQSIDVVKEDLFSQTYHYRSRFTADVVSGMESLVKGIENIVGSVEGKRVLDVGCNDGSLLDLFHSRGCVTIGVEPTGAITDADKQRHHLFNDFFDLETANEIVNGHGIPDIITFTNVFAHIENLPSLLDALAVLIGDETIVVIENHYLGSVLDKNQFDTFYHEHPRTYSLKSFLEIAKRLNCQIIDLEFPKRYGGNIRVSLSKDGNRKNEKIVENLIQRVCEYEEDFYEKFNDMNKFINQWKKEKKLEILTLTNKFGKLPCKAFPGRAAILMKLLELDETHISAVYEKPGSMKIGHVVPGTRIPILSDDELIEMNPKVVLNLAWHIESEIVTYLHDNNVTGQVISII